MRNDIFDWSGKERSVISINLCCYLILVLITFGFPEKASANTKQAYNIGQNNKLIYGKVINEKNEAIEGAAILLNETKRSTLTDSNGNFSLEVPSDSRTFTVSFIGFKTQKINIGDRSLFTITLEQEFSDKNIYRSISEFPGSMVSISSDQINDGLSNTLEEALNGRSPGVLVTQTEGFPGAMSKIRIRGINSINANKEPLFVIDGFPISQDIKPSVSAGIGISKLSILATMNPQDIESIEILKDASETSIYGARGSNGVILITTKSGKNKEPKIHFNASFGVAQVPNKLKLLSGNDFIEYFNHSGGVQAIGSFRTDYAQRDVTGNLILDHYTYNNMPVWKVASTDVFAQHDWQDELFRTAQTQNYNLSFSGETQTLNYRASFGYFAQDGTIIGSDYQRYTGTFRLQNQFSKRFSISTSLNAGYIINDGILSATENEDFRAGVITSMMLFRPVFGYDSNGSSLTNMVTDHQTSSLSNPVKFATEQQNSNKILTVRPSLSFDYTIVSDLKISIKLSSGIYNGKLKSWYPESFGYGLEKGGGFAILENTQELNWMNENIITYKKLFNDTHYLSVLSGFSQQKSTFERFSLAKNNFQIQSINVDNIGSGTEFDENGSQSTRVDWALSSWFGRINYTYKNRYLFTLSGTLDGSSRFPDNNKWAFFPSGAIEWNISEEPFMDNVSGVNDLKIHISYGKSGNEAIDPYTSLSRYVVDYYSYNGSTSSPGFSQEIIDNNDLSWETTAQTEVGFRLGILNRINFEALFYDKKTSDLLLYNEVPYTTGLPAGWYNIGAIQNHGFEFTLNTTNITTQDFSWTTNFNISFNKNQVKKLSANNQSDYFLVSGPGPNSNEYIVKVGEELGSMYGYIYDGVYQLDQFNWDQSKYDPLEDDYEMRNTHPLSGGYSLKEEELLTASGRTVMPGDMKLKDIAGAPDEEGSPTKPDGIIDANDRTIIGHANPKHFGGLSNTFNYKRFTLNILLNWVYGNDIFNENLTEGLSLTDAYKNQFGQAVNRWRPDNPTNELWGINGLSIENSSYYVEDGSFLRLSNITLWYNLPEKNIKSWKISDARIFISGDNMHVWTKYSGYDPEVSIGNNGLTPGIDFGAYPRSRTIRIGFDLIF